MLYFAYGSNLNQEDLNAYCLNKECPTIPLKERNPQKAILKDYELMFNYYSITRKGGAANIMSKQGAFVEGVVFDLKETEFKIIYKKEGAPHFYQEIKVDVEIDGKSVSVITFKVLKEKETSEVQRPTREYLDTIIQGAKEFGLSEEWIRKLKNIPTK